MASKQTPDLKQLSAEIERVTAEVRRLNSDMMTAQGTWLEAQKEAERSWAELTRLQQELSGQLAALYRLRTSFAEATDHMHQSIGKKLQA